MFCMSTMGSLKEFLYCASCLNWLTITFFTRGWAIFLRQEIRTIGALCIAMASIDYIRGTEFSCIVSHWLLIVLFRRFMAGGICVSDKRLDGQTVVITGCNVGIGKETARELSRRGAKIVMACRNTKAAEKTADEIRRETGKELLVMELDLASLSSVRNFAKALKTSEKMIHILINNAGVIASHHQLTEDGIELHMGTNHFGHFLLTNLLLPLLIHSEPARIINVSALLHAVGTVPFDDMKFEKGYSPIRAYSNTKVANILFTRHLARRLRDTNIQVFSLHPGVVQSSLGRNLSFAHSLVSMLLGVLCKKTNEGAQTTVYCALEAKQDDEHHYFSDCAVGYTSKLARDERAAKKLWNLSEKMVGLQ